jgi:hypothetical protein
MGNGGHDEMVFGSQLQLRCSPEWLGAYAGTIPVADAHSSEIHPIFPASSTPICGSGTYHRKGENRK